jgi:hypothetical protein
MGCVYCVTCSVNGKRYVGKTKHSLAKRRIQHHSYSRLHQKSAFHKALTKYGTDAFEWAVLYESDDELSLFEKEKEYIAQFATFVPNGYNLTTGGDGNYDVQFDAVWKLRNQARADALGKSVYCLETDTVYKTIAEAGRLCNVPIRTVSGCCASERHLTFCGLHFCYATDDEMSSLKQLAMEGKLDKKRYVSEEARLNISIAQTGKKMSSEFCERTRIRMLSNNPFKGKTFSPEVLRHMSESRIGIRTGTENPAARAVYCVELSRTFPYIRNAVVALGLPKMAGTNISSCCSGKLKTAYGYHWRYADDSSPVHVDIPQGV